MDRNHISLELPKILEMLAENTACPDAYDKALKIEPSGNSEEVEARLEKTQEAHSLVAKFGAPSFGGLVNVDNAVRRAEAGGSLSMHELLEVSHTLAAVRGICVWREKSAGCKSALDGYFNSLYPNKYLEDLINNAVLSDSEISDNASPEIKSIRRKIRAEETKIREKLNDMIHSQSYRGVLQEAIITQRNGRFVLPVKSEHTSDVPGMIHDASGSGATVFIEPAAVVKANNEIKTLQGRERDEIERILLELSQTVGSFADTISQGYHSAVELNLIFAKAFLAYKMKAAKPVMNSEGIIDLKRARHPLLPADRAVPIDIRLGEDFDTLVVTGPNTGGKTVSIKTVGLLTLMAECGLFVPAAETSRLSVFKNVFSDIGEEQSIEQSLSTFSAHMTTIVSITKKADEGSLILIDELGAGTDPVEGAALAVAVLEALRQNGAKTAATTHYSELKEYALRTERVENASCEFDIETLSPTYRLLIGVPGRSNAFAICSRLGLDEKIIENAKSLISAENTRFEDILETLENTRLELENEQSRALRIQSEAEKIKQKAQYELEKASEKGEKELQRAREEARHITENAKRAANSLMLEIDMLKKEQAREKDAAVLARKARAAMKKQLESIDDITSEDLAVQQDKDYVLPRPLRAGDRVFISSLGTEGTVLSLSDGKGVVEVQAGLIKTKAKESELRLLSKKEKKRETLPRNPRRSDSAAVSGAKTSVDLRGMDSETAIMELDRFIDGVLRSGLNEFTVIHGKGTGTLRKAVQAHLRTHPNILSYRTGVFGEGEEGVTIAEIK